VALNTSDLVTGSASLQLPTLGKTPEVKSAFAIKFVPVAICTLANAESVRLDLEKLNLDLVAFEEDPVVRMYCLPAGTRMLVEIEFTPSCHFDNDGSWNRAS
jgi:hypothetical protein